MADYSIIPSFGTKDPDDIEDKNFDVSPLLTRLGLAASAVSGATVFVAEGDASLTLANTIWSSSAQRVSFRWSGGTGDQTYLITCRVTLSDGRRFDQSATVTISTH